MSGLQALLWVLISAWNFLHSQLRNRFLFLRKLRWYCFLNKERRRAFWTIFSDITKAVLYIKRVFFVAPVAALIAINATAATAK